MSIAVRVHRRRSFGVKVLPLSTICGEIFREAKARKCCNDLRSGRLRGVEGVDGKNCEGIVDMFL